MGTRSGPSLPTTCSAAVTAAAAVASSAAVAVAVAVVVAVAAASTRRCVSWRADGGSVADAGGSSVADRASGARVSSARHTAALNGGTTVGTTWAPLCLRPPAGLTNAGRCVTSASMVAVA
jgi:hypothetical protein